MWKTPSIRQALALVRALAAPLLSSLTCFKPVPLPQALYIVAPKCFGSNADIANYGIHTMNAPCDAMATNPNIVSATILFSEYKPYHASALKVIIYVGCALVAHRILRMYINHTHLMDDLLPKVLGTP